MEPLTHANEERRIKYGNLFFKRFKHSLHGSNKSLAQIVHQIVEEN